MAYSLPAVGFSDCSRRNELIVDEKNGLLVQGNELPVSFARHWKSLWHHPNRGWNMAREPVKVFKNITRIKSLTLGNGYCRKHR